MFYSLLSSRFLRAILIPVLAFVLSGHGRYGRQDPPPPQTQQPQAPPQDQQTPPDPGEVLIRLNQVGYRASGVKIAQAMARAPIAGRFTLVDDSGRQVFEGRSRPIFGRWGEFTQHAELDFSAFNRPGRYHLRCGSAKSPPVTINAQIYDELPDQMLDFIRQQRCGYNPFYDAVCHSYDSRTAYGPRPPGAFLGSTGGWHDAGDLLKYLLTSSNATAQLLLAYLMARDAGIFPDRVNGHGRPGVNGLVDVLDEARWGLDWMLRLHPAPEELYHQVADDRDHQGWRLPQNERVDYGWGPGLYRVAYFADGRPQGLGQFQSESTGVANLAGRYAAAMALGFQVWRDDQRLGEYAQQLLKAAREVYALGRAKEGFQQGNSYGSPYRYEETTWADDMEWGAAELYRATGDKQYLEDAKRYGKLAASDSWIGREETRHYQYYPFMNIGHYRLFDFSDAQLKKTLAEYYRVGIESALKVGERNPFRIGVPFIWCSINLAVALATQVILYERMTGDRRYRVLAAQHMDWILGRNPWGFAMVTGIPKDGVTPRDVHNAPNAVLKRAVRGGLVDGPVYKRVFEGLKGISIRQPDPLAPFHDERAVYHDDIGDYATNEPTMDGTASAILLWALAARY
jgi:hypothetical protein